MVQTQGIAMKVAIGDPGDPTHVIKPNADGSINISGSVTAGTAFVPTGNATRSVSNVSARVALGSAGPTALITNTGDVTVYVKFGDNTVVATTNDTPIPAQQSIAFNVGTNTYVAAITAASTSNITITTGTGIPSMAGGGSSGGGGTGSATATNQLIQIGLETDLVAAAESTSPVNVYPFPTTPKSGLTVALTTTTSTAVTGMSAPATGSYNWITQITIGNSHATVGTFVELQNGSGGSSFYKAPAAVAYGGAALSFPTPLKQPSAGVALYAKCTTSGANVIVSVNGFQAPAPT